MGERRQDSPCLPPDNSGPTPCYQVCRHDQLACVRYLAGQFLARRVANGETVDIQRRRLAGFLDSKLGGFVVMSDGELTQVTVSTAPVIIEEITGMIAEAVSTIP